MVSHIRAVSIHRTFHQRHRLSQNSRTFRRQIDRRFAPRVLSDLHVPVVVLSHLLLPFGDRL